MPPPRRDEPSALVRYSLLGLAIAAWHLTPLPTLVTSVLVVAMPVEHDVEIGLAYVESAGLDRKVVRSHVLDNAVQSIAGRVLAALPRSERDRYAWQFAVLDDRDVNAFALPGGFVYLNLGLLRAAGSAEEVAGVLAHEMGHVLSRHSQKRMIEERLLGTLFKALTHEDGDEENEGFGERMAETLARGAMQLGGLKFSRANEFEADARGAQLLRDSGVGVSGMVTFFESLLKMEGGRSREGSGALPLAVASVREWMSTHPATTERIATLRAELDALPPRERQRAWAGAGGGPLGGSDWSRVKQELSRWR
jgi:predicted Zn-dependent protease